MAIYINVSKKLKVKESEISVLTKKVSTLSSKAEKREAFRVDVDILMEECEFDVVKIRDIPVKNNVGNRGKVKDLSFGGMKLISEVDLPAREHVLLRLKITIKDQRFELLGEIKRKEEYDLNSEFVYGIKFNHIDEEDKQALYQLLNTIEARRKKKQLKD